MLKGGPKTTYVVDEPSPFTVRVRAEMEAKKRTSGVRRRAAWRTPAARPDGRSRRHRRRGGEGREPRHSRGADEARQARRRQAALHPLDAGHLRPRGEEGRAALPAGRRRRERADLRPARRLGQGDRRQDRPAPARLPGRAEGPVPALPAGQPLSVLHGLDGDRVPLARSREDVDGLQGALGHGEPQRLQLRLHAGAAAGRRSVDRLGPHRPRQGRAHRRRPATTRSCRRRPGRRAAPTCR